MTRGAVSAFPMHQEVTQKRWDNIAGRYQHTVISHRPYRGRPQWFVQLRMTGRRPAVERSGGDRISHWF